jgi:hypothetical protein
MLREDIATGFVVELPAAAEADSIEPRMSAQVV